MSESVRRKNRLKSVRGLNNIYSAYRERCHILALTLVGTRLEERYWRNKYAKNGNDAALENWSTINHTSRNFLIEEISKFSPKSILEVGSNAGANLFLLSRRFPTAKIRGIDINPILVQEGNELFNHQHIENVRLLVGKADKLPFSDDAFEVTFTRAALMYIGRDRIVKAIEEMFRVTTRALVFLEWHDSNASPLGKYAGHWIRNLEELLMKSFPGNATTVIKLPKELWQDRNWQKYGHIVQMQKKEVEVPPCIHLEHGLIVQSSCASE
jgi:ubiquinone/menaquinone biosynthesis C-methylase UbiE